MSSVFSKNKGKHSRSSTSEANNSFVKNVTSRVSGLLPATITKWFSSPSSSENGSAPVADISDSSSDDEAPENPVITQPAKRMRLSSQGSKFSTYIPQEPATLTNHTENPELQGHNLLYNTIQSTGGRSNFIRETNYVATPYISPGDVSNIEIVNVERSEKDLTYKSPHIVSTKSRSLASKRKSLFEESTKVEKVKNPKKSCAPTTNDTSRDIRQPCYRPALFGSPFYPGRTMYGGASSSIYINQPNIKKQEVAHVKESPKDSSAAMSTSAKRVMDLLENYSSPLMDAKRIPVYRSPKRPLESDVSRPSTSKSFSYKTQELHVPSAPALLRIKHRSRLMDTTKAARQIIASHSSTLSGFQPYVIDTDRNDSSKTTDKESTGKLKTRLTRINRGDDQFDAPEPVQLPTAVLQIDKNNLPKFTISSPPVSTAATPIQSLSAPNYKPPFGSASVSHSLGTPITNTVSKATIAELPARSDIFKFASPVAISHDSHFDNTSTPKFTFGSPERNIDKLRTVDGGKTPQAYSFSSSINKDEKIATKSSAKSSKEWRCPVCMIVNDIEAAKCAACSEKQPLEGSQAKIVEKCTVCKFASRMSGGDKCLNCHKASTQGNNSIPLPIPQPADPSKWKCEGCWVTNEEQAVTCAACGNRNPKIVSVPEAPEPPAGPASPNNDAPEEQQWKCKDCWIMNKHSVAKCAACGGSKSPAKENAEPAPQPEFNSPFNKQPDEKLAEIARAQKARWECSSCLVRNDNSDNQCSCCGMDREGHAKENTLKPFAFPKESNVTFKFGIDPIEQKSNLAKKAETVFKMEPTRSLEEPETNNNNIPTFTFTLPGKKDDVKLDSILPMNVPKMAFTFGVPKSATVNESTAVVSTFSAASTTTQAPPVTAKALEEQTLVNKPQEAAKPFGAGFFTSTPKTQQETTTNAFSFKLNNEIKELPIESPSPFLAPASSTENPKNFTFSVGGTSGAASSVLSSVTSSATTSGFSFGVPQRTAPQQSAPQQSAPQQSTLQLNAPQPSAAQQTVPHQTASQQTAPQQSPPQQIAPQQTTLQQTALQQNALEQKAPQQTAPQQNATASTKAPTVPLFQNPEQNTSLPITMFGTSQQASTPAPAPAAPLFNFGSNNQSAAPAPEKKPSFNFSFGNNTSSTESPFGSGFKPAFGSANSGGSNAFSMPAAAPPPTNSMGNAEMSAPMSGNNEGMSSGIQGFSAPPQESMWSASGAATTNVFGASNSVEQKPAPFTFGAPNPFNASATPSAAQPSLFVNQPAQNLFGMMTPNNTSSSQPAQLFSSPAQPAPPPTLFGAQPAAGIFGATSQTPAFGAPSQSPAFGVPTQAPTFAAQPATAFEAPSMTPQPAPNFSFGAQPSSGVFGFGAQQQQQQQPQQQQPPQQQQMYGFGANTMSNNTMTSMNRGLEGFNPGMGGAMMNQPMGMQFNMGSAPASNMRRMRKAVRRNQR